MRGVGRQGEGTGVRGVRVCLVERGERGREGGGERVREAGRGKLDQSEKTERSKEREGLDQLNARSCQTRHMPRHKT